MLLHNNSLSLKLNAMQKCIYFLNIKRSINYLTKLQI